MALVDGKDDEQGQRIIMHVRMLRESCMAALLDMAAQQFGLNQRGVLRIPSLPQIGSLAAAGKPQ
ncbi:hypothetical protein PR202_ga11787 [Eleusine coracana subsp. coracana]|uniref:Uncharacterized protein n=1 Tax=Eleusine coracana subsp. coracana TaxID=191504 RepID=A0AAV5CAI6_ELECO|nr:hypothetical protein PR202_ga11787 [Eleusine coracana subsp. coracana]